MNIFFISGAISTVKFWQNQESYFNEQNKQITKLIYAPIITTSINSFTEHAQIIAENFPENAVVIAFSMGCYTALELIKFIPGRINKLILINGAATALSQQGKLERKRSIELIENNKFDLLINLIFKKSIYDKNKYSNLSNQLIEMAHKIGSDNYQQQLSLMIDKPDQSEILSSITCPTLIISSRQDKIMPITRSIYLKEKIPQAELEYINQCGHLAPLEQSDKINKILINWLNKKY